jgi:acyl-coenzyme A thioesterase PaaI-like protein
MTETPNDFDFEWVRFLGAEPVEMVAGRCVMRLEPRGVHLNHNQTVNAPVLYGLAEVAGAGAVAGGMMDLLATAYVVVKRADIEYLAPARGAVTGTGVVDPAVLGAVTADVAAGRPADCEARVEIADGTGRIVSRVGLTMAIRPRRT